MKQKCESQINVHSGTLIKSFLSPDCHRTSGWLLEIFSEFGSVNHLQKAPYCCWDASEPCCCWVAKSCPTLCDPMDCSTPGFPVLHYILFFFFFTIFWSLLKLISIELVMLSNHVIHCFFLLLTSIFPSVRVFSKELALCIRWPKFWSFSFTISPSYKYLRLISFRIDWFDLAV